jgi:hypothetical protein
MNTLHAYAEADRAKFQEQLDATNKKVAEQLTALEQKLRRNPSPVGPTTSGDPRVAHR